jgi:hypothetical protein
MIDWVARRNLQLFVQAETCGGQYIALALLYIPTLPFDALSLYITFSLLSFAAIGAPYNSGTNSFLIPSLELLSLNL